MNDSFVMQGKRRMLVEELRSQGIIDEKVLEAIGTIPRHLFIMKGLEHQAYMNKAISIDNQQTISQPYTVAFQTQLLEVQKGDKILEIGTGSGYQAAVLALLNANVYSIERIENLHIKSTKLLNELSYNVKTFYSDGNEGLKEFAPFDKILVTAASDKTPNELLKQLKIGGFLVAPIGIIGEVQTMKRYIKISETKIEEQNFGNFAFVPMLKGKE
jgi:protein-L-isoaspartate(D-aspartate) O-methyltransferase